MKWCVSFKWYDLFCCITTEVKKFNSEKEARTFYNKIRKETRVLLRKYGRNGIYHPYFNIIIYQGE